MPTENKVTLRDKKFYLEQIAERDKQIYDLQTDCDLQIAEKNRTIAAYRGVAEIAAVLAADEDDEENENDEK